MDPPIPVSPVKFPAEFEDVFEFESKTISPDQNRKLLKF